jgi:phosphotriesterase-related protein
MLHTTPDVPFEALADWFNKNRIPPDKILFCHLDKVSEFRIHQFLTDRGFMIEYDALIREKPGLENLAKIIKKEISSGMGNQILFGGDMARISYWKSYGGKPGMAFMLKDAASRLIGNGIQPEELEKIWIENPKRWLD